MKKITIATRGSKLALWQAEHIRSRLLARHGNDISVELLVIKTKGDIILDVPLAKVGGKGLFVKEIEEALLSNQADLAVHSMKDVPMELPPGLCLGAVPQRENPADLFLSSRFPSLADLPAGARVGTSSLRRQAQLFARRPDLSVISLRGNVDTRLRKLNEGEFDAIIMAAAGLLRLGLSAPYSEELSPPAFLPAAGQGAIGVEFREDRADLHSLCAFLEHEETRLRVTAERAFLLGLQGGCQVPIAGYATLSGGTLSLEGLVAAVSGSPVYRRTLTATMSGTCRHDVALAHALGLSLAENLKNDGAKAVLDELYKAIQ